MQLLVSVADDVDAAAALDGGADVIDAKNPAAGPLGAVQLDTFHRIRSCIADRRPLSAAIGDSPDPAAVTDVARAFALAGAASVKLGYSDAIDTDRMGTMTVAAAQGARSGGAQLVGALYADRPHRSLDECVEVLARAGARGILLDTADKGARTLPAIFDESELRAFVRSAHAGGLFAALAGGLTIDDLPYVREMGADIAGVRGAVCEGGRSGRVTADRVRLAVEACRSAYLSSASFSSRS